MFLVDWELWELGASDCPKIFAFETTANAGQLGVFVVSWLLNFGRDYLLQSLQSRYQNRE